VSECLALSPPQTYSGATCSAHTNHDTNTNTSRHAHSTETSEPCGQRSAQGHTRAPYQAQTARARSAAAADVTKCTSERDADAAQARRGVRADVPMHPALLLALRAARVQTRTHVTRACRGPCRESWTCAARSCRAAPSPPARRRRPCLPHERTATCCQVAVN